MGSISVDGLMMPPPRKMPRSGTRTDRSQGSSPRRSDASLCSDVEISFTQDERADDITWGQTSVPGQLAPANEFTVEEDESATSEEIAGIFGSLAAPGRAGGGAGHGRERSHRRARAGRPRRHAGRALDAAAASRGAHEKENAGIGRKPSASGAPGGILSSWLAPSGGSAAARWRGRSTTRRPARGRASAELDRRQPVGGRRRVRPRACAARRAPSALAAPPSRARGTAEERRRAGAAASPPEAEAAAGGERAPLRVWPRGGSIAADRRRRSVRSPGRPPRPPAARSPAATAEATGRAGGSGSRLAGLPR